MSFVRQLLNRIGGHVLPYSNPRVVCPPGGIPRADGQPVVVASIMRSGTHLAIDLLLNHFRELVGRPLYVDVDRLLDEPARRQQFLAGELPIGACVIKTHYPQSPATKRDEEMIRLAAAAKVLLLRRDSDDTYRSQTSWGISEHLHDRQVYQESVERFYRFWEANAADCLQLEYDELIDRDRFAALVERVGTFIGLSPSEKLRYPINPKSITQLAATKASTRLLGKFAPVINTGIRSGMTKR